MPPEEKIGNGCSCFVTIAIEIVIALLISPLVFPMVSMLAIAIGVPHLLAYPIGAFACLVAGWAILYIVGNPI